MTNTFLQNSMAEIRGKKSHPPLTGNYITSFNYLFYKKPYCNRRCFPVSLNSLKEKLRG